MKDFQSLENLWTFSPEWFSFFLIFKGTGYSEKLTKDRYLENLIDKAVSRKLHTRRFWHLLLHYKKNIFRGYESEEDGKDFFNAPSGKTDPESELVYTLKSFFREPDPQSDQKDSRCIFPARYKWLKSELSIDPSKLADLKCERLAGWLSTLNPEKITMVFAAYYMNNPASMFGHTLLRIDTRQDDGKERKLLNYGVNYSAPLDTSNPFIYAVKAIFGMYRGSFSLFPYYTKVQKYINWENRDLWEYELNFTDEQMDYFLLHLWELGGNYFNYYYFRENCSYHILSLLEVANPALHLKDRFLFSVIPSDTVKVLTEQSGLVSKVLYRPSLVSQMKNKILNMTRQEKKIFYSLTNDSDRPDSKLFTDLPEHQRARILDTYLDYLQRSEKTGKKNYYSQSAKARMALTARSKINFSFPELPVKQFSQPPEKSHGSARVALLAGIYEDELFQEFSFRPAYHDLLASDTGYAPNSQILFFDFNFRRYDKSGRARLDRLALIDIISISPYTTLFKNKSWKFSIGIDTVKDLDCNLCNSLKGDYGLGLSYKLSGRIPGIVFALANLDMELSRGLDKNYRAGGGVTAGIVSRLSENTRFQLRGDYFFFRQAIHLIILNSPRR